MKIDKDIAEAAVYLIERLNVHPEIGMILGSGMGAIADSLENVTIIEYHDIPHMPVSTAAGHSGRFVIGNHKGVPVICMQGRVHIYEGYSAQQVAFPVFIMAALGVTRLIVTNNSGAINLHFQAGDLMLITDHINLTGTNPLLGPELEIGSARFPDMTYTYTPALQKAAHEGAARAGISLRTGVYAGLLGPNFETPAEIRYLRTIGADAVGMSTVTEVIAAAGCGMEIVGLAFCSNMAAGILDNPLSGEDVVAAGENGSSLIIQILPSLIHA